MRINTIYKVVRNLIEILKDLEERDQDSELLTYPKKIIKKNSEAFLSEILMKYQTKLADGTLCEQFLVGFAKGYVLCATKQNISVVSNIYDQLTNETKSILKQTEKCVQSSADALNNSLALPKSISSCTGKLEKSVLEVQFILNKISEPERRNQKQPFSSTNQISSSRNRELTEEYGRSQ
ncbi:Hypothetical protein CINCED_3A019014 [Cinara cedri]|uniref:Uncharacterized protein n=1 Tax=Cinara cedri TaxID=506608 RepID=A0A5E4NE39_9HEMI|nr:Hypothetical protein CINCED_3A019014 [Cinara cedri]